MALRLKGCSGYGRLAGRRRSCSPMSVLEMERDQPFHFVDCGETSMLLSVDEEGRRRPHPEGSGAIARLGDTVEKLLVGKAGIEAGLGEAQLGHGERHQLLDAAARRPLPLLAEKFGHCVVIL